MTDAKNLVAVSQEDREAAAAYAKSKNRYGPQTLKAMREGQVDYLDLIQAFARHRLASAPSGQGEEIARQAIAEANSSLFGSQGYFLSLNGGEPDKYHLARAIEELKALSNKRWRECEQLREAAKQALNFIENTEGEIGDTLSCGDALRSALSIRGGKSG